jgi:hypothetical protein
MITTQNKTGTWVKKLISMLLITCSLLLIMSCLNPLDETSTENGGDGTGGTTSEELELLPAPGILSFTFTPAPLVVGTDTITGGKVAGTLTGRGGSGGYTFEKLEGGQDDALFDLADNELIIASDVVALDPGPYSILVKVTDSAGLSAQKYCKMEVTRSPALVTTAPTVYPYMLYDGATKAETGFNKITVQWGQSVGATDYTIYISTASNPSVVEHYELTEAVAAAAEYKLEIDTFGGSTNKLPKGETYLVWLTAKNDDGATPAGPKATVTTSQPVPEWWYQDEQGRQYVRWDSDTDEYNIDATTVKYNWTRGDGYPAGFAYKGVIRHHRKYSASEARSIEPRTHTGKLYENLSAGEFGVFIIEYIHADMDNYVFSAEDNTPMGPTSSTNEGRPGYLRGSASPERYFFGVYYWGAGITMQTTSTDPLAIPHNGMRMMYTSNSWPIKNGYDTFNEINYGIDCRTYEQALERFTLKNMDYFIAFVATPWYPVFDGMVKDVANGAHCPHHQPFTVNGKSVGSGTYEYRFTSNIPGSSKNGNIQRVAYDLEGEDYVASSLFDIATNQIVTKTSTKPSLRIAFSGHDSWVRVSQSAPGEVLFAK